MRLKMSGCVVAITLCTLSLIACGGEPQRPISLEKALKAADTAAGFPNGRPNNYDVLTAKLVHSRFFRVEKEDLTEALKDMESMRSPEEFWLIVYQRWPLRLDDELIVFIDAKTGGVIRVFRTRLGKKAIAPPGGQ